MAISVRTKLVEDHYTPESQTSEPNPTVFTLKALTTLEYMDVIDSMDTGGFTAKAIEKLARYSFISATNLIDEDNKPAKLDVDGLEPALVFELCRHVMNMSTISEDEKKT